MDIERAMQRVRLHDLQTLVAVVEAGGMRKAARIMHLSQSAVSRVIGELESTLGLPLLERGARGVEPTLFGMALVKRAKVVFDDLKGALRELGDLADPGSGEVRLGCMETLHAGLVGATIHEMLKQHPRMRIVLESGQSPDQIGHFLPQRLVDFVVARPYQLPLPPDIEGEALFCDHMRVAVGHRSPFARRRRIALRELLDEFWILSRNELMPESPLRRTLEAEGLPMPERVVCSGSLVNRYNLLNTGRFVTLVPHSMLPFVRFRDIGPILPIELATWTTPTMILTLRGRLLGPSSQLFLDGLRRLARPLALADTAIVSAGA